ncbi:MAG TPA: exopolysaccharide biosynthesis protein [Chthoniobacter sp.]|jgi:hypothetical protein
MTAQFAVPGDAASGAAPLSTGPSTKRSTVTRRARPATTRAKTSPKPKTAPKSKSAQAAEPRTRARRTSEILRGIIENNPQDQISVEQIVAGLGTTSFGTSLMVFSIPEVVPIPIPGLSAVVALPTGIISAQMIGGKGEVRLPKALLKRSIPRKAFAGAVKAIMPFLERAEKGVRPRWHWATTPLAKRFLGGLIFILAGIIALPVPITNMPPAIAIFIIALGLVERDGKLITLGIALGLASIALIGGAFLGLFSLFGA